jgi:hypothetical protein
MFETCASDSWAGKFGALARVAFLGFFDTVAETAVDRRCTFGAFRFFFGIGKSFTPCNRCGIRFQTCRAVHDHPTLRNAPPS